MAREAWTFLILTIAVLLVVQPGVSPASGALDPETPKGQAPVERIPEAEAIRDTIAETTSQLPDSLPSALGPSSALDNASQALPLVEDREPQLPEIPDPRLPEERETSPVPSVQEEGSAGLANPSASRQDHPPIVVVGDEGPTGFEIAPGVPRPGSGVRGGSGTAEDPYVISDWNVSGIRIVDTDAHVRIETNTLTPPPDPIQGPLLSSGDGLYGGIAALVNGLHRTLDQDAALLLENADNVTVTNNDFLGEDGRLQATGSDRLSVQANEFGDAGRAIAVHGAEDVSLEDHAFPPLEGNNYPPVFARDVQGLAVDGNDFVGNGVALALVDGSGAQVSHNRFAVSGLATAANGTEDVRVANNTVTAGVGVVHTGAGNSLVEDNDFEGVLAAAVAGNGTELSLQDNTVKESFLGLLAEPGSAGSGTDNDVREAAYGVIVAGTSEWTIAENNVTRTAFGSILADADSTLARNNFTDAGVGTLLAGEGGHVTANAYDGGGLGLVLFDARAPVVEGNRIEPEAGGVGFLAVYGEQARFVDNTVPTGQFGGLLFFHSEAHLSGNSFQDHGLFVLAPEPEHAGHTIDASNTLNGEPIHYLRNTTAATVSEPAGQVLLANTTDIHVDEVTLDNATVGIQALHATGTRIANTTVSDSLYGAYSYVAPETTVENSQFLAAPDSEPADAFLGLLAVEAPRTEIIETSFEGPFYASLLLEAEDSRIAGSSVDEAALGHLVLASGNVEARNNTLGADLYNLALVGSPHGTLRDNAFLNGSLFVSKDDPTWFGTVPGSYDQDIDASNTVNGDPLRYRAHAVDTAVPSPAGQVFLANTTEVRVEDHTIEGTTLPVFAVDSTNLTVQESRLAGSLGVAAIWTDGIAVNDSSIAASAAGVVAGDVSRASITENTITATGPAHYGVYGYDAPDLQASNNTVQGFPRALSVFGPNATLDANVMEGGGIILLPLADQRVTANTVNGEPVRYLDGAEDRVITEPTAQVLLARSHNVTARNLDVAASSLGVLALDSSEVTVDRIDVEDQPFGVVLVRSPGSLVQESTFRNVTAYGLALDDSPGSLAVDNRVLGPADADTEPQGTGLYASATSVTLRHNTVQDHFRGLTLAWGVADGNGSTAEANEIRDNTIGVDAAHAFEPPEIHQNNIHGNELAGLLGDELDPPDATHNWWGCPGGPSKAACDDVLGPASVDPWLTEPNEDAGAGGGDSTTATATASTSPTAQTSFLGDLADAPIPGSPSRCTGQSSLLAGLADLPALEGGDGCGPSLAEAALGPPAPE